MRKHTSLLSRVVISRAGLATRRSPRRPGRREQPLWLRKPPTMGQTWAGGFGRRRRSAGEICCRLLPLSKTPNDHASIDFARPQTSLRKTWPVRPPRGRLGLPKLASICRRDRLVCWDTAVLLLKGGKLVVQHLGPSVKEVVQVFCNSAKSITSPESWVY